MTGDASVSPEGTTNRFRWWIHLVLIGGYFAASIPLVLWRPALRPSYLGSTRVLITVATVRTLIFLIVFFLACQVSGASRDELLLKWRPKWWVVPLGIGYSIAMRIVIASLLFAVAVALVATRLLSSDAVALFFSHNRPQVERIISPAAMRNDPIYFWLTVTFVSFVVAGLREELWRAGTLAAMRALWPSVFGQRHGEIVAVTLIAIVFGLAHWPLGLVEVGVTAILGFFLGIIMVMHRSIWPAVIAHGAFDATSFATMRWAEHLQRLQ